jgi:hypothetical protein
VRPAAIPFVAWGQAGAFMQLHTCRPPEQTGYAIIETREPETAMGRADCPSTSNTHAQQQELGPALPAHAGQLLEEFFNLASELKDSVRAGDGRGWVVGPVTEPSCNCSA